MATPNASKAGSGFSAKERPAARLVNYLLQVIYGWIVWFDSINTGTKTKVRTVYGQSAAESGSVGPSGAAWRLSVGGVLIIPLPDIDVGKRILAIRLRAKDGTSSAITSQFISDVDGTRTTISTQTTGGTNTLQTITHGSLTTTVAAGTVYYLRATSPSTTTDYYRVEVDYDSPSS